MGTRFRGRFRFRRASALSASSPVGGVIAAPTLRSAGWWTGGLAIPQTAAAAAVQVGTLETQVDVRNRWDDGSVKFAQITCKPTSTVGDFSIRSAASGASGTFTPHPQSIPTASVSAVITAGQVTGTYVATMPTTVNEDDLWLNGPLVKEWRHSVIPLRTSDDAAHPSARVHFDCRVYVDGFWEVSTWFTNIKDAANMTAVTADFSVTINDAVVGSWASVYIGQWSYWRRSFTSGAKADVAPDFTPFYTSQLIHKHQTIATDTYTGPITDAKYEVGGLGDYTANWEATGKRPDLGFTTAWNLIYLVHKRKTALDYAIRHSELLGRWHGSITKGDGVEPLNLDTYPNFWLDSRATADGIKGPLAFNSVEFPQQNAHKVNAHFIPYMVTGDRYFYDAQRQYGLSSILFYPATIDSGASPWRSRTYDGVPGGSIVEDSFNLRGIGRGFQEMVHAWQVTTDDEINAVDKAWWRLRIEKNLDAMDLRTNESLTRLDSGGNANALGYLWPGAGRAVSLLSANLGQPVSQGTPNSQAMGLFWMKTYLLFPIQRALDNGITVAGTTTRDEFVRWMLVTSRNHPDYDREWAFPFRTGGGAWWDESGAFRWITTPAELFTFAQTVTADDIEGCPPLPGQYGAELRAVMRLAQDLGDADGADLVGFIDTYSRNGKTVAQDLISVRDAGLSWDGIVL